MMQQSQMEPQVVQMPTSNGAFDTSAIKSKLSVKRPPGGKVRLLSLPNDSKCSRLPLAVLTCSSTCFQMSKKALMDRAKEDRKKSDTGEKAKVKPKGKIECSRRTLHGLCSMTVFCATFAMTSESDTRNDRNAVAVGGTQVGWRSKQE